METQSQRTQGINFILSVMQVCGLWPWPIRNKSDSYLLVFLKRNFRYFLHLPITFTFIGLMWLEALESNNLEEAGQVLYMSITEMALIIKILNIWNRSTNARQLMLHLQDSPEYELRSEEEDNYWQREQRYFKWLYNVYQLVSLGVVYSSCVGVLFLEEYVLPFPYFVPFEWQNEHGYYYAFGYNMIAMTLTCIANVSLDCIGCYFLFHVSLLYRLLGTRLKALSAVHDEMTFNQELRCIFKLHDRTRRLTIECQAIVSPYILSQIILSAFIICFSGYRLQHVGIMANPGQFISMLQFLSVMVLQIFLPCYYGNEVTFYAHQLTNKVYNTNWMQCEKRTCNLLIAYMEHLKRPVKIRAGYFFEVGLPIFVKTINNAYSFFALLLNFSK
ncbi:GH22359 [Drosophila grimshawi]|uniref:Odorant receptor n=2 Tax=Drosophila grimshawi TaxID=7222 RepID=B4JSE7_DROGR|nr:GH22359 [Drosophila grimshawi]